MFSQAELQQLFEYRKGKLYWKQTTSPRVKIGDEVGTYVKGHLQASVKGKKYYVHRLIWAMHYGGNIPKFIDHINGVRDDNRIENLRLANHSENQRNQKLERKSSSGIKGLVWNKRYKVWKAHATIDGKRRVIGSFKNKEDAVKAVASFKSSY